MGPVYFIPWLVVACGKVILVIMLYSWSPGIFRITHYTYPSASL